MPTVLDELRALISAGRLTPGEYVRLRDLATPDEVAELADAARAAGLAGIGDNGHVEELERDALRLPRMLTAAERRRPVASPVVREALERARALSPDAPMAERDAIVKLAWPALRAEPDEEERWRLHALLWDALGLGVE